MSNVFWYLHNYDDTVWECNKFEREKANELLPLVSNLACDYKGKRIVNSNVFGVDIQVYDGSEWRYLFGAKDLVSAKNAIDKLF